MGGRAARLTIAGVLACALLLALPITASAVKAQSWDPWFSMREVAENPGIMVLGTEREWSQPDIDGDHAVYSERRQDANGLSPGTAPGDWNIYLENLNTNVRTAVAVGAGNQSGARICGDWVVYVDAASGNDDVKAYRISTGATVNVAVGPGHQRSPDVSGSRVVYHTDTPTSVRVYDLSTGTDALVLAGATTPAISGNRIVCAVGGDLKVIDLVTGGTTTILNDAVALGDPRIDGEYIVYMKAVALFDWDVVVYNISNGTRKVVSTGGSALFPDVDGTKAVWARIDGGSWFLEGYDFERDKVVTLADVAPDDLTLPKISGNNVVFVRSDGGGEGEIHLGAISAPTLSLKVPSVDRYGAAARLTGKLTENGIALGLRRLDVLKSTNRGHTWTRIGETTTTASGAYSYLSPANFTKTWYRVRFNGETEGIIGPGMLSRFSAISGAKSLTPRAAVGKPTGYPSPGRTSRTYSVYGSLKPMQAAAAAASKVVVIKCYRKQGGRYVLRKTYNAKVYDHLADSRYKGNAKLPYAGSWRMHAYFKGSATNAANHSPYRYVTVR